MNEKMMKTRNNENTKSQENLFNTGITISQLNDDCLRCILFCLPIKDRLRLQRVSKRWQTLMPWSGQNKLKIKYGSFTLDIDQDSKFWIPFSVPAMKRVLYLCGNFITDVQFSDCHQFFPSTVYDCLKTLKELCPNLVSVNLCGLELIKPLLEFVVQNFSNSKCIGIGGFENECETIIAQLFVKAKNLRAIKFSNSLLTGTCFSALPFASIEELEFLRCDDLSLIIVCDTLQNMTNLRILDITDNLLLLENIDILLEKLPNKSKLECLRLQTKDPIDSDSFTSILQRPVPTINMCYLTNLQELILTGPQVVHDETLTIIGNTCTKLKKASIIDSNQLTDDGWKNFAKLKNIEKIRIEELYNISDKCLRVLHASSLKELICYNINVTNESLQDLLKSAKNLNFLEVALCEQINIATLIKDASAQIESRPKYEILRLQVEIPDDIISKIENISSRLVVKNLNGHLIELGKRQS